jgi:hypothetical protein
MKSYDAKIALLLKGIFCCLNHIFNKQIWKLLSNQIRLKANKQRL